MSRYFKVRVRRRTYVCREVIFSFLRKSGSTSLRTKALLRRSNKKRPVVGQDLFFPVHKPTRLRVATALVPSHPIHLLSPASLRAAVGGYLQLLWRVHAAIRSSSVGRTPGNWGVVHCFCLPFVPLFIGDTVVHIYTHARTNGGQFFSLGRAGSRTSAWTTQLLPVRDKQLFCTRKSNTE